MFRVWAILIIAITFLLSCSKEEVQNNNSNSKNQSGLWLVPFNDILYWGDPADEIVSIDSPEFKKVSESEWDPENRMLVLSDNGEVKIYPVIILEEHEIVNDKLTNNHYTISYCPITGSGMAWNRSIGGKVTEFGVSGMLYNDNLVLYDRNTNSYWSQMLMLCINGELIESQPDVGFIFETSFEFVFSSFPDAKILIRPDYNPVDSHGSVEQYKSVFDEVDPENGSNETILISGEYYYGVISGGRVMVFNMDLFKNGIIAYQLSFYGKSLMVVGSKDFNFIVSFEKSIGSNFSAVQDQLPIILKDELGNEYDIFGNVIKGPDIGNSLIPGRGYRAKGFAWESIFNKIELYEPM